MRKNVLFFFLLFFLTGFSWAQNESEEETWDFDFSDSFEDIVEAEEDENTVAESLGRSRVTMIAAYNFYGGFSPGWSEFLWLDEKEYSYILAAKLEALISLDFQLSKYLRVWNSFYFSVPPDSSDMFSLKEFYFDYSYKDLVFLQLGQYEIAWGISPFFPFTNLPVRLPAEDSGGDAYIAKIDIPIGIGGLQLLGMTRYGFMKDTLSPKFEEIAFGMKFNLALQSIDIDIGTFYHKEMPLHFFTSIKTTLGSTELYTEGLATVSHEKWDTANFSVNLGGLRDFFRGKLTVAGEVFYNGEDDSYWYRAKDDFREAKSNPFFGGWNSALSFIVRPGFLGTRIFCRLLYAHEINSAQLVPGISIKPFEQLTVTLSVPMALGSREDYSYYRNNEDRNDRPFSIILGATISGSFRYRIYMDRSAN